MSIVDKFLKWALGRPDKIIIKNRPFHRIGNCYTRYTEKSIEGYIKALGFVEQNNGSGWRNGFVCIDHISGEIWHTMSTKRTKMTESFEEWVGYFKTL